MSNPAAESLTDRVATLQASIAELRRKDDLVVLLAAAEAAVEEIEQTQL